MHAPSNPSNPEHLYSPNAWKCPPRPSSIAILPPSIITYSPIHNYVFIHLRQVPVRIHLGPVNPLQILALNQRLDPLLHHIHLGLELPNQLTKRLQHQLLMRQLLALPETLLAHNSSSLFLSNLDIHLLHDSHNRRLDAKLPRVVVLLLRLASLPVALHLVAAANHAHLDLDKLAVEPFVEKELVRRLHVL
jgi:hypothetical protein